MGRRRDRHCPPCARPSSNSSLDHRHSDARAAENGFAAKSSVNKSAKVVLTKAPARPGLSFYSLCIGGNLTRRQGRQFFARRLRYFFRLQGETLGALDKAGFTEARRKAS